MVSLSLLLLNTYYIDYHLDVIFYDLKTSVPITTYVNHVYCLKNLFINIFMKLSICLYSVYLRSSHDQDWGCQSRPLWSCCCPGYELLNLTFDFDLLARPGLMKDCDPCRSSPQSHGPGWTNGGEGLQDLIATQMWFICSEELVFAIKHQLLTWEAERRVV